MLELVPKVSCAVRHLWPESKGFHLNRPNGLYCYTFLHFLNPVNILTPDGMIVTEPNACYVYPPDTPQFYSTDIPMLHNWFHFDGETAEKWTDTGLEFNKIYYVSNEKVITELTYEMELEYLQKRKNCNLMIESKIQELFVTISRQNDKQTESINGELLRLFTELRVVMIQNSHEKWTIQRMADYVHLSASYFQNIYKKIYGIPPKQDLINMKIDRSKNMLVSGKSIFETSRKLGYTSTSQFSHQFSHMVGVSPKEYIKMNK